MIKIWIRRPRWQHLAAGIAVSYDDHSIFITLIFLASVNVVGLPLDSPQWEKIDHAYGKCDSTLSLLCQLNEFADACEQNLEIANSDRATELLRLLRDEFGNNLFHQQTIYSATIAAVPHFVELANRLPLRFHFEILHDVAWIQMVGGFLHAEKFPGLKNGTPTLLLRHLK